MEPDTIFWSLYAFYLFSSAWDVYLSVRQYALYRRTTARPASVEAIISESDFDKARAYQLDKMQFAFITDAFNFVLYSIVFLCTLYPSIWTLCSGIALWVWPGSGEIWHSVVFVLLCSIAETAITLPFSYYSTFYIEQRYGFNKETIPFFFKDRALKLGVSLALSTPVVALLIWIIRHGGENFHIYAWAALSVIIFVMMFVYPEFIAPLFDKYTPLPDSELKRKIETLASQVGFPLAKLYVVENSKRSTHSNAYMYGFWKNKRIVLFDTLLSKEMNELMKQLGEESKSEHKKAEDETDNEAEPNKTTELEDAEQEKLEEAVRRFHGDDETAEEETGNEDEGKNGTAAEKEHRIGMDDDEVVAVLGHELGHWKLCHSAALLAITEEAFHPERPVVVAVAAEACRPHGRKGRWLVAVAEEACRPAWTERPAVVAVEEEPARHRRKSGRLLLMLLRRKSTRHGRKGGRLLLLLRRRHSVRNGRRLLLLRRKPARHGRKGGRLLLMLLRRRHSVRNGRRLLLLRRNPAGMDGKAGGCC
uniref:Ste24 endopeptidase n=1 Tax=Globodera rostochiensis TaxID=31243 RepID=A0A914IAL2_GLORO